MHLVQPKIREDSNSCCALLAQDSVAMREALLNVLFNYFAEDNVIL